MADDSSRKIKSIAASYRIVGKLQALDGAGVTELAEQMDLGKSTVYQYLSTLHDEGYVVKRGHTYHLGLKYLHHGMYARNERPVVDLAQPSLETLVDETGEVGWITCEDHGKLVTLDSMVGEHDINEKFRGQVGNREYLHAHAGGKAILAAYSDDRVTDIVESHGLPVYTEHTITDRDRLFDELDRIREEGVAFNDEEAIRGYRAVSAAVTKGEETVGSITIGGPKNRLNGEYYQEELPSLIRGAINEIELRGSVESPWN